MSMKRFRFILILLVLKINLSANVDAYEQRVIELTKSRNYKELYQIMDKEVNYLKEYKHSDIWAQMYEGGFGVPKNAKKAVEFHKKAVNLYKKPSSAYRLGQYYFYGKNVEKKDYRKAAYWWRVGATLGSTKSMYSYASLLLQNRLNSDFFNYLVASKWIQFSAKKGNKEAKDFLSKNPELKNLEIYLNLRTYNIEKTPYEKKLAGVVLGEKFNEELLIPYKNDKRKPYIKANRFSINYYKNVSTRYADKDNPYSKNLRYLNVKTTLFSDTVYRVEGFYFFNTKNKANRFKKYYFEKLLYEVPKSSQVKSIQLKNLISYIDIGVTSNISKNNRPYGVQSVKNLKGIRHLVEIYQSKNKDGYYVKVTIIDFSSLKLKIAEALEYDLFFSYIGEKYIKSYRYMNHFGLTLLQKIPNSISKQKINSSNQVNKYSFSPHYSHKFFQDYIVTTSLLSNTILEIKALGVFKDGMDVYNAKKGIKKAIFNKYKLNDDCWSFNDFVISSRKGVDCLSEDLNIEDTNILIDYKRDKNNNYILYFKAYSKFAKKIKDKEYWLLNN